MGQKKFMFLTHYDFNLLRFRLPIMVELIRKGNKVIAVCPSGQYSNKFLSYDIHHIPWNCIRENKKIIHEIRIIYQLKRIIQTYQPDLIHTFTIRPNLYGALAHCISKSPAKLINSVTGLGSLYVTKGIFNSLVPFFSNFAYKLAFRRSSSVIFQNNDDRSFFLSNHIIQEQKAQLIRGSGVNIDTYHPIEDKTHQKENIFGKKNAVLVLLTARLIREKGILEFCQAAEILKKKYKDKAHFVVIGDIDTGNPSCLSWNDLDKYRGNQIIQFTGHLDDPQPYFAASDIYCLPSYREGLPVTVLEAMASGLPIVTTDAPGCRDTVDEGINGFKVPVRNVEILVDRLERLIVDADLRRRMGEESRKKAVNEFSVEKIVKEHIALYEQVLNEKL